MIQWKGQETLRYTFGVVRLWEIPAEVALNTTDYALWPLAALMRDVTVESATAVAEQIATAPLPLDQRSELTGLLVVLSEVRLGKGALLRMLRRNSMIDELVKHSGLAEEFREEGRREGRAEAIRELVQSILEARFGPLNADVLAALKAADESILRTLAINAGAETLEQIRAFLKLD